jgi:LacI family transcriptional regulator
MVDSVSKTIWINLFRLFTVKITLKTIADEAGLSVTTVSRALAGYDDVNEATRQRVMEIAERLGYQPNLTARHLRSKQTSTIGMVIPRTAYFADSFFMELLAGVGRQASAHGYDLLLSVQPPGDEELAAYRRMVAGSRVDGIVLARVLRHDPRIAYLQQANHPFVSFGRSETSDYPYIDVDGARGMRRLVQHLAENGHRRIAIILSPWELAFTTTRYEGYLEGLDAIGVQPDEAYVAEGDLTQQGGRDAAARMLALPEPPTAIIACNDLMAFGVMEAVEQRGLRVGHAVAVAGFDDVPAAAHAIPPLTTLRQPIYAIGCQMVDMLVRLLRGETLEHAHVLIEPELMVRASSGPQPAQA